MALVYNVLKTFMEMNGKLFDELTGTYKMERQRERKREKVRDTLALIVSTMPYVLIM